MLAAGTPLTDPDYYKIQTGSLAGQSVIIRFVNASKESLGVDRVGVSSHGKASEAIKAIQEAIEKAALWRDFCG